MNFAELKDRVGASCGVLVEELLDDVCRQLWLAAPFASRGKPALDFYFCLPVSISISSTKFSSGKTMKYLINSLFICVICRICALVGDCVQLPSAEDLAEKRYLVKTDDRPTSVLYLNNIAKWLATLDQVCHYCSSTVINKNYPQLVVYCICLM